MAVSYIILPNIRGNPSIMLLENRIQTSTYRFWKANGCAQGRYHVLREEAPPVFTLLENVHRYTEETFAKKNVS